MKVKRYHVFSDEVDEWFVSIREAKKRFEVWAEELGCARLYCEEYRDITSGEPDEEYCLKAIGPYPY